MKRREDWTFWAVAVGPLIGAVAATALAHWLFYFQGGMVGVAVGLALASLLALAAGWAWWNRRCPKCATIMVVHEVASSGLSVLLLFKPLLNERQECPACGSKTPLRSPHNYERLLAGGVLLALAMGSRYLYLWITHRK